MYNNIFDTHAHYDDTAFDNDRHELLKTMFDNGVTGIVSCGCDIKSTKENLRLSEQFDNFYFAAGYHPETLENAKVDDLNTIKTLAKNPKCVAIGEIGLDYHWMTTDKTSQKDFLIKQIDIAKELNLPVIIHDRDAHGDILDILKKYKPKGVLHCFSGSAEMAKEIINIGMYIGLNGVVTFKNARKSLEVVKEIPLSSLVLETDCPYLAPEPNRGKRNDSLNIPYIAQRIGEILNVDTQDILTQTNINAKRLYMINHD